MEQVEIWKDISGYEGYYQVSTLGQVKSVKRIVRRSGHSYHVRERMLNLTLNKYGYSYVGLAKDGIVTDRFVHRLVAIEFIPNPNGKPHINHINGHKADNTLSNLEWCTDSENMIHSYRILGRKPTLLGRKGVLSHLSRPVIQFSLNMDRIAEFVSIKDAEAKTGAPFQSIQAVCAGRRNKTHGFIWKYKNETNGKIKITG